MTAITAPVVDDSSDDDADYAEKPPVMRGRSMRFLEDKMAAEAKTATAKEELEEAERKSGAKTDAFAKYPASDPRHPFHKDYTGQEIAHAPRDW